MKNNTIYPLVEAAKKNLEKTALVIPQMEGQACVGEENITFGDFLARVNQYQAVWNREGYTKGDRLLIVAPPSIDMYTICVSLTGLGMVPVFIDMGMGRQKIQMAVEDAGAKGIVSVKALLRLWWVLPQLWKLKRYTVDKRALGCKHIQSLLLDPDKNNETIIAPCEDKTHGFITFTSGSTGRPKGANRDHGSLSRQHHSIKVHWPHKEDDIDMPCFPVVTLHNLTVGMTTIMPKVNLANPAGVNASQVIAQINEHGVTRMSGAPAYMEKICDTAISSDITLDTIQSTLVGGATVPKQLAEKMLRVFPNADQKIVYGSTEAEPISAISVEDYLAETENDKGYRVGIPPDFSEVLIANLPEEPVNEDQLPDYAVGNYQSGEILVSGPQVLREYIDNPAANAANKIRRSDGGVWHRTGDTGYFDENGELWLVGRVKDQVTVKGEVIHPFLLEQALDPLPSIVRSALVQDGSSIALFLQTSDGKGFDETAVQNITSSHIKEPVPTYIIESMPVDGRHNSKIDRPMLRKAISDPQKYGAKLHKTPGAAEIRHEASQNTQSAITTETQKHFIITLNPVDYLTLSVALSSCLAVASVLQGSIPLAIAFCFVAMLADAFDGILARRLGTTRPFGRYLDGFMDVFAYLVAPSLILYQMGMTGWFALPLVLMIMCGCIRLSVFNEVGNIANEEDDSLSYLGMPVFWSTFILAGSYLLQLLIGDTLTLPITAAAIAAFSIAMIYNAEFFKVENPLTILYCLIGAMILFLGLHYFHIDAQELQSDVIIVLWLQLPLLIALVIHMVIVTRDWIPVLKIPIQQWCFGKNKTWRGMIVVPIISGFSGLILYLTDVNLFFNGSALSPWLIGFTGGLGYMLAELPNSFIKRRLNINPGESSNRFPALFTTMDQLDSTIGVAVAYYLIGIKWEVCVILVILSPLLLLFFKRILYSLKLKKTPV